MHAQRHTPHRPNPLQRPALPLLLSDLSAASQMLSTAIVLPEQFYPLSDRTYTAHGVVALMRAVLEEALHCFQQQSLKSGRRAQRLAREAEEWFFTDDPHWLFSFVNICAVLDLDPGYIRQGITQWHQQYSAAPREKQPLVVPAHRPLKIAA